ncbi:MAG TPA: hypothetical protein VGN16_25260 [Acidobacteriaceae bacterium]|jgi:hypothetical protein
MAHRSFSVRIEEGRVFVKHHVPALWATLGCLLFLLIGICFIPGNLHSLAETRATGDFFSGFKAVLGLCIPLFAIWMWLLLLHAGEVLECDAKELHHARQRMWGYWRRWRYPCSGIQALKIEIRPGGKTHYHVLTFQYERKKVDTLMGISAEDADRILKACQSMGLDVSTAS